MTELSGRTRLSERLCAEVGPDLAPPQFSAATYSAASTWLPAALLATLVMLVSALQALGGEPLVWRSASQHQAQVAAQRAPRQQVVRVAGGYAVRTVAYEYESQGPALGSAHAGGARVDGLVMENSVLVAQQPATTPDDLFGQELAQPFGTPDATAEALPEPPATEGTATAPDAIGETPAPIATAPETTTEPPAVTGEAEPTEPTTDQWIGPLAPTTEPEATTAPANESVRQPEPLDSQDNEPAPRKLSDKEREELAKESRETQKNCSDELAKLKGRSLSSISLTITVPGEAGLDYPFECTIDDGTLFEPRSWSQVTYLWKASGVCSKPLYFEQPNLERYGHSWGPAVQPIICGAHFFTRLPALPYAMGIATPNECIYPLGYYRPGSCAPYTINAIPFTWRAAVFEAGAWVGGAAIVP